MFCPKCGKQVKEDDNFCRYCGTDLRTATETSESYIEEVVTSSQDETEKVVTELKKVEEEPIYTGEELVLYDFKKHWMSLFWPVFLTPLFFIYFWSIFLNTHSFFSWIVVMAMLILIIYPIARYKSDKLVVTTRFIHIKIGILNPAEFEIPLEKVDVIDVSQSSMGRYLDYGTATFCLNSEKYDYPYIKYPEDLQYIIDDPKRFLQESLEEE